MTAKSIHFQGDDFLLHADDLDPQFADDLRACGAPGDAGPAVKHVRDTYKITGCPADCIDYLYQYGAWTRAELRGNHHANLDRIVWLVGSHLAEDDEVYFPTY